MNLVEMLHAAIPTPCFHRPFVCDGFPQQCNVIVIGQNPATPTQIDWWEFWTDKHGFDLKKFEQHYEYSRLQARAARLVSPTRLRLNYLRQKGLKCLETNAFSNERPKGHGTQARRNDLLQLLVEELPKLKAVITHGKVAAKRLQELTLPSGIKQYCMPPLFRVGYASLDPVIDELR